jgi:signal transduction histidine kinase
VAAAAELARQAQGELTELLQALRPVPLADQGLATALRELVRGWERQSGIAAICQVSVDGPLPDPVEQALFRVAQEALANVARHSGANTASLCLTAIGQAVTLQVSDNGRGFDVTQPRRGLGLQSMQERMEALGGQLSLESGPQGTRLTASLPRGAGSTA